MDIQNPNLPADRQNIDNLPLPEDGEIVRLLEPCKEHKVAFPSNSKRLYPELTNMSIYLCQRCSWYCYEGKK
jgi:hypothetical protein